jgi:hypothetical protein
MDQNKLRTLVFEKTGIKIDTTDPVFAVVALNEAVLSEYVDRHVAAIHELSDKLSGQTRHLLDAGERYRRLHELEDTGAARNDVAPPAAATASSNQRVENVSPGLSVGKVIALVSVVALFSVGLTLIGQSVLVPQAKPVQATQAIVPALTAKQVALMRNGEKYAKVWPKLDVETQAKIQELMQQP